MILLLRNKIIGERYPRGSELSTYNQNMLFFFFIAGGSYSWKSQTSGPLCQVLICWVWLLNLHRYRYPVIVYFSTHSSFTFSQRNNCLYSECINWTILSKVSVFTSDREQSHQSVTWKYLVYNGFWNLSYKPALLHPSVHK